MDAGALQHVFCDLRTSCHLQASAPVVAVVKQAKDVGGDERSEARPTCKEAGWTLSLQKLLPRQSHMVRKNPEKAGMAIVSGSIIV
jgi:hypothetical protein